MSGVMCTAMFDNEDLDSIYDEHEESCKETLASFERDLKKLRTGRASSAILENLSVDYYSSKTPLSHLAQISTPEARLILVQVYDASAVAAVEKAIRSSDLGLNPSREGNVLRISIPPLTEEGRREVVKHIGRMAEDRKVSVRGHRRDANDSIKVLEKDNQISKDDGRRVAEKIQKQTDLFICELAKLVAKKEKECMEV